MLQIQPTNLSAHIMQRNRVLRIRLRPIERECSSRSASWGLFLGQRGLGIS